ncbi:MAG: hypothetical protein SFY70_02910 [Bacteroidia bacterium]|nr:hypothetical protein [Bacteroidia bacterium]
MTRNLTFASLLLLAGLALTAPRAYGQNTFLLMAVSGDVQYTDDGSSWNRARTGLKLQEDAKLKVAQGAYAAVILNNTKTFEMKQSGTYNLRNLVPASGTASSSVSGKYVDYVVNRSTSNKAGNNMANLGAVERSLAPQPLSPMNSKIIDNQVTFIWRKQDDAPSYFFKISDINGNELYTTETADTFVVVDVLPLKLNTNEPYYWQIANTRKRGMPSGEPSFVLLGTENRAAIQKAAEEIKGNAEDPNSAICNIFLGQYYAEQQVYDRAMMAYANAVNAHPDVEGYRKIYAEFLAKIGLASYAKEILGTIRLDN